MRMQGVDTIAAVATPPGVGGIGVVRVSGPAATMIAQQVFVRPHALPLCHPKSHRLYYGYVVDTVGERVDEAMLCLMCGPRSYTREDVVEISCHGGPMILQRVLETVVAHGARVAEPGEFTKRAFMNGRLDLAQAEAVIALINARTRAGHRAALQQLDGALSRALQAIREELLQVSVYLEAGIDFPEEDVELITADDLRERLERVAAQLDHLLGTFERGRLAHEGLATAIVGRPNVGKSSLLNALLGRERAIVSPQPGTTRDTIEAALDLDGVLLRLTDMAGIRSTTDVLEQEGVRRARQVVEHAEMLVVVLDGSTVLTPDDHMLLTETDARCRVLVRNKSDLPACWTTRDLGLRDAEESPVAISAVHGTGLAALERALVRQALGPEPLHQEDVLLTQVRHRQRVAAALQAVHTATDGLRQGTPVECVAFDVTEAFQQVAEILGEQCSGEVLDRIFSSFCIGK